MFSKDPHYPHMLIMCQEKLFVWEIVWLKTDCRNRSVERVKGPYF